MRIKNIQTMSFIALGVMAVNAALMANGVETMPGMWAKEVYQDPTLAASIGGMSGFGIGGAVGLAVVATQETVQAGTKALRKKFTSTAQKNNLATPQL